MPSTSTPSWEIIAILLATDGATLLSLIALLPWVSQTSLSTLGLRWLTRDDFLTGLVGAVLMLPSALFVGQVQIWLHLFPEKNVGAITLFTGHASPLMTCVLFLIAVLFAPIVEECVFRGFVFNALKRHLPVGVAAIFSALAFSAAHAEISEFLPLAIVGLFLAAVYTRTKSLTASMLTHGLFNLANLAMLLIHH
jgi:membrane protease YdiL (CAAX protease family)